MNGRSRVSWFAPACICLVLWALVVGAAAPRQCLAQSSTLPLDDSLRSIISTIATDKPRPVRLSTAVTGRIEGDRVYLDRNSVVLTFDSVSRAFMARDIDSVWTYRGTAALTVGMITAFPCAIYGALVGGLIGGDADSNGSPRKQAVLTLVGFGAGALVCGSIGAAIGSSFHRWRLEYARPVT